MKFLSLDPPKTKQLIELGEVKERSSGEIFNLSESIEHMVNDIKVARDKQDIALRKAEEANKAKISST